MELDADNLRAALSWLLAAGHIEMAARMACALAVFWRRRGHYSEGQGWLEQVLPHVASDCLPDSLRASTLQAAGSLAYRKGDWSTARQWLKESLILYKSCGYQPGIARVLFDLGWIAIEQGDWSMAARLNEKSLAIARKADDQLGMYRAMTNLGWTRLCKGEENEAFELFTKALILAQQSGHTKGIAVSLANLGWIALRRDDLASASNRATESLRLCHLLGEREVLAECLEILAVVAVREDALERAACLSGASQVLWERLQISRSPAQHSVATYAAAVVTLHKMLPGEILSSRWRQGREMGLNELAAFVLEGKAA
jgi:tetratricopeptide (TPR) repeat protein